MIIVMLWNRSDEPYNIIQLYYMIYETAFKLYELP